MGDITDCHKRYWLANVLTICSHRQLLEVPPKRIADGPCGSGPPDPAQSRQKGRSKGRNRAKLGRPCDSMPCTERARSAMRWG
eukprot:9074411-Pyramimonas_sp.AAC.1